MNKEQAPLGIFKEWYKNLKFRKPTEGPARGTIGVALVVLEKMQSDFSLDLDNYRARGKGQLKGMGPAAVKKILSGFGEDRPFLKEGGRTNRGAPGDIESLLAALKKAGLEKLSEKERNLALKSMQEFLVEKVREYHNRKRMKLIFETDKSLWESVKALLALAKQRGKDGPVAQYLIGAKLQLRFPEMTIENSSYSTADDQLGRPGDFFIGDTVFHVTVSPSPGVFEKCKVNLSENKRVYIIVPENKIAGARQIAENYNIAEKVSFSSVESFVSQNIDEISSFSKKELLREFRSLLETYNKRVDAIESDKSLMIEIPENLLRP